MTTSSSGAVGEQLQWPMSCLYGIQACAPQLPDALLLKRVNLYVQSSVWLITYVAYIRLDHNLVGSLKELIT